MRAGKRAVPRVQPFKILLRHIQIVRAGRPQPVRAGRIHQKLQRHTALRQILTSLPVQRLEQRYQHGPGHIVLIAYFPRDIRPAQHACTAPGLDLHYVVDVSFQPAGTCPALCVTRSQRMKK